MWNVRGRHPRPPPKQKARQPNPQSRGPERGVNTWQGKGTVQGALTVHLTLMADGSIVRVAQVQNRGQNRGESKATTPFSTRSHRSTLYGDVIFWRQCSGGKRAWLRLWAPRTEYWTDLAQVAGTHWGGKSNPTILTTLTWLHVRLSSCGSSSHFRDMRYIWLLPATGRRLRLKVCTNLTGVCSHYRCDLRVTDSSCLLSSSAPNSPILRKRQTLPIPSLARSRSPSGFRSELAGSQEESRYFNKVDRQIWA